MMQYIVFPFQFSWFLLVTVTGWALSFLPKGKKRRFHKLIYRYWSLCFYRLFWFRETVHRHNTKPIPSQYIMVSNHYSGVDTIWLPGKFNVIPLAKNDLEKWPLVGKILKAAGMIFVDRHRIRSRSKSIDDVKSSLQLGNNVLIFPEGGCHGRYLHTFKEGAFSISKMTGIPIYPAYLFYEDEDTFELRKNEGFSYMLQCLFSRKSNRVHLHLFDAFYPSDYETVEEYLNAVTEVYLEIQEKCKGNGELKVEN
ncbi:MAG: lysophospholipid acyltransferase family protein [Bacteroidota bacterium]